MLLQRHHTLRLAFRSLPRHFVAIRHLATHTPQLSSVPRLADWDQPAFRHAYDSKQPVILPYQQSSLPPACRKWFAPSTTGDDATADSQHTEIKNTPVELNASFWTEYESLMVSLELTTTTTTTTTISSPQSSPSSQSQSRPQTTSTFHRSLAPLKILLSHLTNTSQSHPSPPHSVSTKSKSTTKTSIYLAQHSIPSLPPSLQSDLPTPSLILSTGRGDLYSSSIWLGRPPTYTPLHRDPNPNLLMQLAGTKVVRLLPPEVGDAVFGEVQRRLSSGHQSMTSTVRGEEMMSGPERDPLHRAVWGGREYDHDNDEGSSDDSEHSRKPEDDNGVADVAAFIATYGVEATLSTGEALFIPKGWWHSVKGIGRGVTGSVNWWFR